MHSCEILGNKALDNDHEFYVEVYCQRDAYIYMGKCLIEFILNTRTCCSVVVLIHLFNEVLTFELFLKNFTIPFLLINAWKQQASTWFQTFTICVTQLMCIEN